MKYFISAIKDSDHIYLNEEQMPLYILETFINGEEQCLRRKRMAKREFMLDSGAFTFMNSNPNVTKNEMIDYMDRYCEFIKKNNIEHFIEMDMDIIFGYDQVLDWRKQIERTTNKQVIPVWHKTRGTEEYKKMCKTYNYVALGGFNTKEFLSSEYHALKQMVKWANRRGVKVHGLGYLRKDLLDWEFHSVDSATWVHRGARGGTKLLFNKSTQLINDDLRGAKKLKTDEIARFNLNETIKYQYWLENKKGETI